MFHFNLLAYKFCEEQEKRKKFCIFDHSYGSYMIYKSDFYQKEFVVLKHSKKSMYQSRIEYILD